MSFVTNLILTESAARRVALIADKQARPAVLRLAVDGGGCSGFTYRFALGEPEEGDAVTETAGVRLVVDPVSLDLLEGSEIDYVEDLGGSAFKVRNPNAASGCGCGSSFGI
jgi:iron-sulfur cluster assembly accessory protein